MTRYRLRPAVSEWEGDNLWIAALPHGQIIWIGGVGALVLQVLSEPGGESSSADPQGLPLTDIVQILGMRIQDLPVHADRLILEFLEQLECAGIIAIDDRAEDAP